MIGSDCEYVDVEVGNRIADVATVTLKRPDARNALNSQLRSELKSVLAEIENQPIKVVVLTGSDDAKAFVAGADVTEFRERTFLEQREASKRPRVYECVENLRQPVIARVNGHALGGGCELIQACDVRVAHQRAKIGQPEINLGIMPGGGGTQRLPRLVGRGRASELVLTGKLLSAEEACEIGLVDHVHDSESFDDAVYDLAGDMAKKSAIALEYGKKALRASHQMPLPQGIEFEAELFAQLCATEDMNEGIDAFFEDRDPNWPSQMKE